MKLVLVRHGQSIWNQENLFTGWTDVPLSEKGTREAIDAGIALGEAGFEFDLAYSSVLTRANDTLNFILKELNQLWIPVSKSWRLNERHYGALQGLNKAETAEKYGEDKVIQWRRSYDTLPPLLDFDDERHPRFERRYQSLDARILPAGESLALTLERVMPLWEDDISIQLRAGKTAIIAAHGNSLRALVKYLETLSDEEIMKVEIPTGNPLVYELDKAFNVIKKYYIKDKDSNK
jgi:2,3-bisphosphoglycerate-dependent phosphoglycerate mutase